MDCFAESLATRAPRGASLHVLSGLKLSASARIWRNSYASLDGRIALKAPDWPRSNPAPDYHRTTKPFLPAKVVFGNGC